jgi:Ig-like domain CHU_C associated
VVVAWAAAAAVAIDFLFFRFIVMKNSKILTNIKRYCSKYSSLFLLFQRAPLIQALLPEASVLSTSSVMNAVPAAITTVVGLGFFDAVAGATTVVQSAPSAGSSTVPVTTGVQLIGLFSLSGTPYTPGSWSITSGTLPAGLTLENKVSRTASLTGRTTQIGSFPVTITAWRGILSGNKASQTFTITVAQSPAAAITSQPTARTINSGETTTLTVVAAGTAPLTYQWYRGDSPNTGNPIASTNAASFTTPALVASTNYWVKVTNSANVAGANSATASVTVLPLLSTWKNSIFNPTQLANSAISGDSSDPDGDGVFNINEYLFGTAPLVAQASLLTTSTPSVGQFQVSFTARAATGAGYHGMTRRYAIETTADPSASWVLLAGFENIVASGQQVNAVVPTTSTKQFYRMKTWLTP